MIGNKPTMVDVAVAVAVGFIALAGVAVETGILVLTFIEQTVNERRQQKAEAYRLGETDSPTLSKHEIMEAVHAGTSSRVRPVAMTATSTIVGLLPIMLGTGTGSDVMQRIAAPMVGGMVTTTVLCLLVLPVIYGFVLHWRESGQSSPDSRQCLDDAHQNPHRHALYRHQNPGRY